MTARPGKSSGRGSCERFSEKGGCMKEKILFAWSGGKDSALALHELLQNQHFEISAILTTVTSQYDRISLHGVRLSLLERQAESVGFPLEVVYIPRESSDEEYEEAMAEILQRQRGLGVSAVAFGDIQLEGVREYRERHMADIGMECLFPLWGKDTAVLARSFIRTGFKAVVTCVDTRILDRSFVGRMVDSDFLRALPSGVDPCGENGEYHSFVLDGPIFHQPISCTTGAVVARGSFCFCDIVATGDPDGDNEVAKSL